MNQITTVAVDLAKDVIVIVGADDSGHELTVRQMSFHGFGQWAANVPPCLFGMEACASLGATPRHLRTHSAAHDAGARTTVSQERRGEERSQRCTCHPHRRAAAGHAVCGRQNG
jgi:transposase